MKNLISHFIHAKHILILLLTIVGSVFLLTHIYQKNISCKFPLLAKLKNDEQHVWHKLETLGVVRSEFESKKQKYVQTHENEKPVKHTVSDSLSLVLTQTARDFDINPDKISFEYMNAPSEAGTDNDTLYINEEKFKNLPEKTTKFVIGHEMQHLKFHDAAEQLILEQMLTNTPNDKKESVINEYLRFQETRADIHAALKNKEYAESYAEFMNYLVQKNNTRDLPSYPSVQDRLAFAQEARTMITSNSGEIIV